MVKGNGRPGSCGVVTRVALCGGGNMGGRLGLCVLRHVGTAVAGGAIASGYWPGCARVTHGCRLESHIAAMADIAGGGCRDMCGRFAHCGNAIVASGACPGDNPLMSVANWHPDRCGVAGITLAAGLDMGGRLAQGVGKVVGATVAGGAIACCQWASRAGMAHGGRGKGHISAMANAALGCGRNMVGRLAKRGGTIVATGAVGVCGSMRK